MDSNGSTEEAVSGYSLVIEPKNKYYLTIITTFSGCGVFIYMAKTRNVIRYNSAGLFLADSVSDSSTKPK